MRKTDAGSLERSQGRAASSLLRMLRLGAVAAAVAFVATAGVARAEDDDDDDMTFEEKLVKRVMTGIGGTNMESGGIDYRERSPLVLPPKVSLPAPADDTAVNAPNWPRDVAGEKRRAASKTRRSADKDPNVLSRPLMPSELSQKGKSSTASNGDAAAPGANQGSGTLLSPSQLGFKGGIKGLFSGNTEERTDFKGEPTRDSLTMPPPGYQTPSPNFAYGTGPKESLNKVYSPVDGKYGDK